MGGGKSAGADPERQAIDDLFRLKSWKPITGETAAEAAGSSKQNDFIPLKPKWMGISLDRARAKGPSVSDGLAARAGREPVTSQG